MNNAFDVLIDSDAFVGWLYPNDAHHEECQRLFKDIRAKRLRVVTTSFVIAETATVLSHRQGQSLAYRFLVEFVAKGLIDIIHITEEFQQSATSIFLEQSQRGTSMTDCANVAVMRQLDIPTILSFDKVYLKGFGLNVLN